MSALLRPDERLQLRHALAQGGDLGAQAVDLGRLHPQLGGARLQRLHGREVDAVDVEQADAPVVDAQAEGGAEVPTGTPADAPQQLLALRRVRWRKTCGVV